MALISSGRVAASSTADVQSVPLTTRLAFGNENVGLWIIGDSTGVFQSTNDPRWVYIVAQQLGAKYPAYTVKYHPWDDTTKTYPAGSVVTLQAGTGAFTLDVWNASTSGQTASYSVTNFAAQAPALVHLTLVSYGHNDGTTNYRPQHYSLTRLIEDWFPAAGLIMVAQNPQASANAAYSADLSRQQQVIDLAGSEGYGLINVTGAFLAVPGYESSLLLVDGLHPTTAGSNLWASLVMRQVGASVDSGARLPQRRPHRMFIPASAFVISEQQTTAPILGVVGPANGPFVAWSLPAGQQAGLLTTLDYPEHWQTINVYVVWSVATGAGYTGSNNNCRFDYGFARAAATATPFSGPATNIASSPPANLGTVNVNGNAGNSGAWEQIYTRLASDPSAWLGRPLGFRIRRIGSNAADTLAESAYVRGAIIERAS